MKSRFTALALVSLMTLAACEDATTPDPGAIELGRPNIAITDPGASYGFLDGFFTFLKPLVADPSVQGETLNQNLQPIIEVWVKEDVLKEESGDHACTGIDGALPIATLIPEVSSGGERYEYGWKTGQEPLGGLMEGTEYRLCVKILRVGPTGDRQLVGWRDVRPGQTNDPNSPPGTPYEFQNGSNVPIKFWLSSKSLCFDEGGNVIDCTIATFGFDGGTATCDAAQCGISVPGGGTAIPNEGDFATFEVRYVNCGVTDPDGTIDYLPIDIPQYPGCLTVTVTANFPWSSFDELGPGLVAAACRDETVLGPRDERLLLHIESANETGPKEYYALPTRQFDLECGPQPVAQAPGPSGTVGDWMRYYAAQGMKALTEPVRSLFAPAELTAAHAGFGGGTSLGCNGASTSGPDGVINCSSPGLAATTGQAAADVQPGVPVEFRMVWALPSKISERLEWLADGDPPDTRPWIDPVSGTAGGPALNPAVLVTDECEIQLGGTPEEDCVGQEEDQPVSGARVTFTFFGEDGTTVLGTAEDITDVYGIAKAEWTLPGAGLWQATAGGLGIGVDAGLTDDNTGVAGGGAYQEHIGNEAVLLETGAVRFQASACSDKSTVLATPKVDSLIYDNSTPIPINVSGADTDAATLWWTSDCYNVYFALEVPASENLQNSLRIVFMDQLENGQTTWNSSDPTAWFPDTPDLGDDMWFISRNSDKKDAIPDGSWMIEDWYVSDDCTGSSKQSECGKADVDAVPAGTFDLLSGSGPVYSVGTTTVYEFARSFASADALDFYVPGVGQSTWIGFYLVLQQGKGAQGNTEYPDFRVFQPIEIVRQ